MPFPFINTMISSLLDQVHPPPPGQGPQPPVPDKTTPHVWIEGISLLPAEKAYALMYPDGASNSLYAG